MAGQSKKTFFRSLLILLCVIIVSGCPLPLKYMNMMYGGKSEKKHKIELNRNRLSLEVSSSYWDLGPGLRFDIMLLIKCKEGFQLYKFKPENILISFNDHSMLWDNPARDSGCCIRTTKDTQEFQLRFVKHSLDKSDIEYLKNTEYPIEIVLSNFIFANDSAVFIDTIFATSPELEYYDSW